MESITFLLHYTLYHNLHNKSNLKTTIVFKEIYKISNNLKICAYTYNKSNKGEFIMEYAKDEIFQIRYNTKLNRLQIKNESWTSRIYKKIKNHKLLTTVVIALIIFTTANIIMIYNFIEIMQNTKLFI